MPLDLQRTVAREVILDKGKVVHAVLEKQVMGDMEQVKVDTVTKEEMWALKLLKTIVALETLITTGKAVSSSTPVSSHRTDDKVVARDSSCRIRG